MRLWREKSGKHSQSEASAWHSDRACHSMVAKMPPAPLVLRSHEWEQDPVGVGTACVNNGTCWRGWWLLQQ